MSARNRVPLIPCRFHAAPDCRRLLADVLRQSLHEFFEHWSCPGRPRPETGLQSSAHEVPPIEIRVLGPRLLVLRAGRILTFTRRPNASLELLAALVLLPVKDALTRGSARLAHSPVGLESLMRLLSPGRATESSARSGRNPGLIGLYERRLLYLRRNVLCTLGAINRENGTLSLRPELCQVDLWNLLERTSTPDAPADPGRTQTVTVLDEAHHVGTLLCEERWGQALWLVACRSALSAKLSSLAPARCRGAYCDKYVECT